LEGYRSSSNHLNRQLVPQKKAYSEKWVCFRHVDRGQTPLAGPGDGRFVDIELAFAAVSQQSASSPSERELKIGDQNRRKSEGACISRIQDRFDLPLLTRWANHHETYDRLALRIHGADNHVA
jgi:hypothetical protein